MRYRGKLQGGGDGDLIQQAGTVRGLSFCESPSHLVTLAIQSDLQPSACQRALVFVSVMFVGENHAAECEPELTT